MLRREVGSSGLGVPRQGWEPERSVGGAANSRRTDSTHPGQAARPGLEGKAGGVSDRPGGRETAQPLCGGDRPAASGQSHVPGGSCPVRPTLSGCQCLSLPRKPPQAGLPADHRCICEAGHGQGAGHVPRKLASPPGHPLQGSVEPSPESDQPARAPGLPSSQASAPTGGCLGGAARPAAPGPPQARLRLCPQLPALQPPCLAHPACLLWFWSWLPTS